MLTVVAEFAEVVSHAGLDTPSTGLNPGAFLRGVGFAGLCYRDIAEQRILTAGRELAEMILDAGHEPALPRLNPGADLVDLPGTSRVSCPLLCRPGTRRQQKQGNYTEAAQSGVVSHSCASRLATENLHQLRL